MSVKYYLKKPKIEITKDIIKAMWITGILIIAGSSPYFVRALIKNLCSLKKYNRQQISSTFSRLKKQGLIEIKNDGKQIYIPLTKNGRKRAGWYQINDLKIAKPKKWDKKWRVVIFDIPHNYRLAREALRGKLKQLGFIQLQKSVWIHPYRCRVEIKLLRNFFGLKKEHVRIIIAEEIEDDFKLKKGFNLVWLDLTKQTRGLAK